VEWFGAEFKVGAVAVGTILAATGTAMPGKRRDAGRGAVWQQGARGQHRCRRRVGGPSARETPPSVLRRPTTL